MKIKRDIVTPYLVFIFIIVGFTGVLMFFHLLDDYTNVVHEFLGLAFVLFALLHVVNNRKSIGNYSKRKLLLIPCVVMLIVATAFIIGGKISGNLERNILERLVKAPVSASFQALQIDYKQAEIKLMENNIVIKDSLESIEELSIQNQRSPEEIMELVMGESR